MTTGKVSHFDAGRGFGFIADDSGGPDVFVHVKYLLNADLLKRDQRVSFEIVMDERRGKSRADRVMVLADDAARKQPGTAADGFDAIAYDNNFLLTAS
jgi:cold shock protein